MAMMNRELYDEAYLRNIDNAKMSSTPKNVDYTYLYNKVSDSNRYKIPKNMSTYFNSIDKYFSKNQLYTNGKGVRDAAYYRTLDDFRIAKGAVNVNKGKPIDPKNIFITDGIKYIANYDSTGYLKCETKGRSYTVRLSSSPENIQEQTSTNTATGSAVGMSQDYNFFTGVSSRVISFNFTVYADYLPEPYQDVVTYCRDLKQMNYPVYSSSYVNSPVVTFVYGGISITGIPNINITFGSTIRKGKIDQASVSVSITETAKITNGTVIGYN